MKNIGIFCLLTLILFASCSKNDVSEESIAHRVLEGSVESNVLEVENGDWADSCDIGESKMRLEIARALDQRSNELKENLESVPVYINKIRIEPTFFEDTIKKESRKDSKKNKIIDWKISTYSWSRAYRWYSQPQFQNTKSN